MYPAPVNTRRRSSRDDPRERARVPRAAARVESANRVGAGQRASTMRGLAEDGVPLVVAKQVQRAEGPCGLRSRERGEELGEHCDAPSSWVRVLRAGIARDVPRPELPGHRAEEPRILFTQ